MFDEEMTHPAFGVIGWSRVSGRKNLFMVDFPQEHYIVVRLHLAKLARHLSNDWLFPQQQVIEIAMSEVQFARFITTPNVGEGIPCTMSMYFDPTSGKYVRPSLPDDHAARPETFCAEVGQIGAKAADKVAMALAAVESILSGDEKPTKANLGKAAAILRSAKQDVDNTIPFVVEQAEVAINKSAENAKAEVNAHFEFRIQQLGERALGAHIAKMVEGGGDPREIGIRLIESAE